MAVYSASYRIYSYEPYRREIVLHIYFIGVSSFLGFISRFRTILLFRRIVRFLKPYIHLYRETP